MVCSNFCGCRLQWRNLSGVHTVELSVMENPGSKYAFLNCLLSKYSDGPWGNSSFYIRWSLKLEPMLFTEIYRDTEAVIKCTGP